MSWLFRAFSGRVESAEVGESRITADSDFNLIRKCSNSLVRPAISVLLLELVEHLIIPVLAAAVWRVLGRLISLGM